MIEIPLDAIRPRIAAVAMAVANGAGTVREVAAACGFSELGMTLYDLREARSEGLVDFADHKTGTLHATVHPVLIWAEYYERRVSAGEEGT